MSSTRGLSVSFVNLVHPKVARPQHARIWVIPLESLECVDFLDSEKNQETGADHVWQFDGFVCFRPCGWTFKGRGGKADHDVFGNLSPRDAGLNLNLWATCDLLHSLF